MIRTYQNCIKTDLVCAQIGQHLVLFEYHTSCSNSAFSCVPHLKYLAAIFYQKHVLCFQTRAEIEHYKLVILVTYYDEKKHRDGWKRMISKCVPLNETIIANWSI